VSKGELTRQKILDHALAMARAVGLEGLSIGALAEEVQMSKSGLFAHFKSKEALQLDVLQEAVIRLNAQVIQPVLAVPRGQAQLYKLLDRYLAWLRGENDLLGCPFERIAAEYSSRSGPVRDRLVESIAAWHKQLVRIVAGGVESGYLRPDLDAQMFVYEFAGMSMVFQQACRLMRDSKAERRARMGFEALLQRSRA
jgi:AcrR family transcriptional regulator